MKFYAYDGASWRDVTSVYAYDGASWRLATECWVYDGASWRQVCGASCATATLSSTGSTWSEANCTDANECQICIRTSHSNCDDACHHLDGFVSVNGGSFTSSLPCRSKSCTNQTGTDCVGTFDCDTQTGGTRCWSNGNTHKPRLEIQRDIGSSVDSQWTYGSTYSGSCIV